MIANSAKAQDNDNSKNPIWEEDHSDAAAEWLENYMNPMHEANYDSLRLIGFEQQRSMDNRPAMKTLSSSSWNEVATSDGGKVSGRGSSIAFDPSGAIYYGTTKGGLFKSTDNGTNWTTLSSTWADLDLGAVAVDPTNPSTIYAATGTPAGGVGGGGNVNGIGIYKSTDAGLNWTLLPGSPLRASTQIEVNPAHPNIVYYGSTGGLQLSDDYGATWKSVVSGSNYTSIAIDHNNPAIIFEASGTTIKKSIDSGKTWTSLPGGYPTGAIMIIGMSNVSSDSIYLSTGNGSQNSTSGSTLALSTNAGQTWTTKTSNKNYLGQQAGYANAMAVNPVNPAIVVAGGLDIYRSLTGGASLSQVTNWQESPGNPDYTHADIHVLKYNPYTNILYVMTDGGIYRSADNGRDWVSTMNAKLGTFAFIGGDMCVNSAGKPDLFAAGAQDNGLSAFTFGVDQTYRSIRGGDGGTMFISPQDGQTLFGTYIGATLYKSQDRGLAWVAGGADGSDPANILGTDLLNEQAPFYMTYTVWDGDPGVVACCGYSNLYLETAGNTGPTAFPAATTTTPGQPNSISGQPSAVNIATQDDNFIYLGTYSNTLYYSEDLGQTWTLALNSSGKSMNFGGSISAITTDPNDATHVYMSVTGSTSKHFWVSTDNGQTWTAPQTNLPALNYFSIATDANGVIYIGDGFGALRSADGGVTWYPIADGLPMAMVTSLHVRGNYLVAATYGRGMYYVDLTQLPPINSDAVASTSAANSGVAISSVYPSMVTTSAPRTNVDYSLPGNEQATLAVYDVLGRQERMLVNQFVTVGTHELNADLSGIVAGQHYLVLTAGGTSVTKPIVIE